MNKFSFIYALIFFGIFISCNNDDDGAPSQNVNDFVWRGLNSWYFWQADVSQLQSDYFTSDQQYNDFINSTNPENLFYNLLYDYPNTDRFSWIVDDVDALLESFSGIQLFSGMDFSLAIWDENAGTVVGMVNYVVPNSPAFDAGIQRGDVFYGVNGQPLTTNNYRDLFNDNFSVTFAEEVMLNENGLSLSGERNVNLIGEEIEENPVHFSTIFTQDQYKIGYLVYNGFRANYNDELNAAFADFQTENVTDLILDLRYNGGGSLNTALALGQMITGQFTDSEYVSLEYNERHQNQNRNFNLNDEMRVYEFINGENQQVGTEQVHSLGLNRLYVLTSGSTASASELTISGLTPYIDVIKIGSETYGKFVGSITLFDDMNSDFTSYENRSREHNYAMQPIVFAYYNSENQSYTQGFTPDYEVTFSDYIGTLGAFGDYTRDEALARALNVITGSPFRTGNTPQISMENLGSSKTLQKFGTELYLE